MPSKIGTRPPFPPADFALRDAVRETSPAEERSALRPMMINVSYYLDAFNEPRKLVVGKMKRERD